MASSSKKQNFLQGASILALAVVIVKVIGAVYKIPLSSIIGDVGYSYFNTAYDIYTLLLTVATAGLPIAMSRMISQAYSLGQYKRVRQIYKVSRALYLSLGLACTLIMGLFCHWLAARFEQPDAWFSILCLAPCGVLMGFMSAYRGFFQGQGNMVPTSTSQVLEAVCKLLAGLSLSFAFLQLTGSLAYAAGGAILGVSISCLFSAVYLSIKFKPAYRQLEVSDEQVESFQKTTAELMKIAIPITIGSAGLQLLNVLEIGVYMDRIKTLLENGQYQGDLIPVLSEKVQTLKDYRPENHFSLMASSLKGIYNFSYTVFNMPCTLIITINTSVLPAITAYLTQGDHQGVRSTEESAARITGLLALPCAVGLALVAEPVMALLRDYTGPELELATTMMTIMGGAVCLYSFAMFTNVLLQSHGKAHIPVINTLLCGAAKLIAVYFLTGNPSVGIIGVPVCSALCYLGITVLNLICLRFMIPQKPALLKNMLRPIIPALLMGVLVYLSRLLLTQVAGITSNLILCAVPVMVGVVAYGVLIVFFKTLTREDCALLPKGETIARLLKL